MFTDSPRSLSAKKEQAPVKPHSGKKLSRADRKEIEAVIARANRSDRKLCLA